MLLYSDKCFGEILVEQFILLLLLRRALIMYIFLVVFMTEYFKRLKL